VRSRGARTAGDKGPHSSGNNPGTMIISAAVITGSSIGTFFEGREIRRRGKGKMHAKEKNTSFVQGAQGRDLVTSQRGRGGWRVLCKKGEIRVCPRKREGAYYKRGGESIGVKDL